MTNALKGRYVMTHFRKLIPLIALLAILPLALVRADSQIITLAPGDHLDVACSTSLTGTIQSQSASLDCAPLPATPTPTPTPDPTVGICGESTHTWHAPVVSGCQTRHEHGDAVPSWVTNAGYTPMFTHHANTPSENSLTHKHSAFKGFSATFNNVQFYGVFHMDTNPGGHASRFHSYQVWARDPNGGVSHWHGWLDFGTGNNTGPTLRTTCQNQSVRPILLVNDEGCPSQFEAWYSRAGAAPWSWDFGFNISRTYYAGGDPADPATWAPTGGLNLTRRVEASWYANRSELRGTFWATQFGDTVSGPTDPLCGTQRSYGTRTYTVLCLEQFIAPTMRTVQFPGNALQKSFPGTGVQPPN
jgi:hypothetical protein